LENSSPQKGKKSIVEIQCYGSKDYGLYKKDCPKGTISKEKEEAHITERSGGSSRGPRKEEVRDLY